MGTRFLVKPSAARYIILVYFLQFIFQMTIIGDYTKKMEILFIIPNFDPTSSLRREFYRND